MKIHKSLNVFLRKTNFYGKIFSTGEIGVLDDIVFETFFYIHFNIINNIAGNIFHVDSEFINLYLDTFLVIYDHWSPFNVFAS